MPELKDAMSEAGVKADSVEISYFHQVESVALVGASMVRSCCVASVGAVRLISEHR